MRLVDRYALAEALPPLLVAILGFLVVLLANSLYLLISSSLAELSQLQPQLLVRYAGLSLPGALVLSLPVGMLLAGTLAVVRLAGDREAFALETAGVTFGRLVMPILLLGVVVAASDLALAGWVAPRADALARQTGRVLIYSPKELFPLPDHFFYMGRGYHFYVERADREAGLYRGGGGTGRSHGQGSRLVAGVQCAGEYDGLEMGTNAQHQSDHHERKSCLCRGQ